MRSHPDPASLGVSLADDDETQYRVRVQSCQRVRTRGRPTAVIVYNMTVEHNGAQWPIRRRYRQVMLLHDRLVEGLGRGSVADGLPRPPPKVTPRSLLLGGLHPDFLRSRMASLEVYFDALLSYIPYVDQCEALREFLCTLDMSDMSYDRLLELEEALGRGGGAAGVDEKVVASLPRRPPRPGRAATKVIDFGGKCVICQDPLDAEDNTISAESLQEDKDIRVLPCGHEYHFECIARWLSQSNACCVCQSQVISNM